MKTSRIKKELPFILMILPGVVLVFIFCYIPMAGISIAFQRFIPSHGIFGSPWVGWDNFKFIMNLPNFYRVLWNTLYIAVLKIVSRMFVAIVVSLMLNEVRQVGFKRTIQTIIYFPHFLSWVVISGIFIEILSPSGGFINTIVKFFGFKPIFFLGDNKWFPFTLVATEVWKEFGFNTIIYLAALTAINPNLYEAAVIDGAGRWKQTLYITLPGIKSTVLLLAILSLGNVLNAGFDQIFNLYSPVVYESGDILDTLIYREGMENASYGLATALGLFKSGVSFVLITISYWLAYRFSDYRIF